MASENTSLRKIPWPKMAGTLFTNRIFSDVASDIAVDVNGELFLLHKFPLVAHSGKIRKLVANGAAASSDSRLELADFPGGSLAFELSVKFCYGINFGIQVENVASLRCAAEYLKMTEEYKQENLIARIETYLNEVVVKSFEKSLQVLKACQALLPLADELGITFRCVEAVAQNAYKEQLTSCLSRFECEDMSEELSAIWWVEDLTFLPIGMYEKVVYAMERAGVDAKRIIMSIMCYAEVSLKGIGKCQMRNPAGAERVSEKDDNIVLESLVGLLPTEMRQPVPTCFLLRMLRLAIMMDTSLMSRVELEKRISLQLKMVEFDDLLIPSAKHKESLFDVDTVLRILLHFLERIQEEECGNESEATGSTNLNSVLKVGKLVDAYLAEIAPDPYLSVDKFIEIFEVLPDYARVLDDGLYRATDIYLKAHSTISEQDCIRLCKFIDCEKLSQEASNHAALNDRLPVQMTIRVLYFEQLRLKNSISGSSRDDFTSISQKFNSGMSSAQMSPKENYASLRRENRELKLEVAKMRVRLSELEKQQVRKKQGMMMGKSAFGNSLLSSLSKGIEKMSIFSNANGNKQLKSPHVQ